MFGRAYADPLRAEARSLERLYIAKVAAERQRRCRLPGQLGALRDERDRRSGGQDLWPAVAPGDREQKGLAPDIVEPVFIGTRREEGRPPVSILRLDKLCMARRCYRIGAVGVECALGENRIARIGHIGTVNRIGAEYDLRMVVARPALGGDQVVATVAFQQVWAFDPNGHFGQVDPAIDDLCSRPDELQCPPVERLHPDRAMALVARRFVGRAVIDDIRRVTVPEDRRIDPFEGQPHRVRPRTRRVFRGDDEIAATLHTCIDDVEDAIVVGDVGREHALRNRAPGKIELLGPIDRIADLRPADQIFRSEDRQPREVREGRVDQKILVADARYGRIGIVSRQDRVAIGVCPVRDSLL
ncbi:hypothetical protein D9M73_150600 [compost metagenome]